MSSQRISTRRAASGQSTPGATTSEPKKSDDAKPEKTERTPAAERAAEKAERAAEKAAAAAAAAEKAKEAEKAEKDKKEAEKASSRKRKGHPEPGKSLASLSYPIFPHMSHFPFFVYTRDSSSPQLSLREPLPRQRTR